MQYAVRPSAAATSGLSSSAVESYEHEIVHDGPRITRSLRWVLQTHCTERLPWRTDWTRAYCVQTEELSDPCRRRPGSGNAREPMRPGRATSIACPVSWRRARVLRARREWGRKPGRGQYSDGNRDGDSIRLDRTCIAAPARPPETIAVIPVAPQICCASRAPILCMAEAKSAKPSHCAEIRTISLQTG